MKREIEYEVKEEEEIDREIGVIGERIGIGGKRGEG